MSDELQALTLAQQRQIASLQSRVATLEKTQCDMCHHFCPSLKNDTIFIPDPTNPRRSVSLTHKDLFFKPNYVMLLDATVLGIGPAHRVIGCVTLKKDHRHPAQWKIRCHPEILEFEWWGGNRDYLNATICAHVKEQWLKLFQTLVEKYGVA